MTLLLQYDIVIRVQILLVDLLQALSFVEHMILLCDFCNQLFYTKIVYKLLVK
jgi:hypothetical protein